MGVFDDVTKKPDDPPAPGDEQAVIVHFQYGSTDLSRLHSLEDRLEAALEGKGVGTHDGHEIAVDGSDGYLYLYGPDAEALLAVVKPVLDAEPFTRNAEVTLERGDDEDFEPSDPDDELEQPDWEPVAREILGTMKSIWGVEHEYALAVPAAFPSADMSFYERTQRDVERLGYRFVADMENRTMSAMGHLVTFTRCFSHPGTRAIAGATHVESLDPPGIVDFETLLSNGHFIVDTNAPEGDAVTEYPEIDQRHHPPSTSLETMHAAHEERVRQRLEQAPSLEVRRADSFDAIVRFQAAMNTCKRERIEAAGWLPLDYLIRRVGDEDTARVIHAEVQRLLHEPEAR